MNDVPGPGHNKPPAEAALKARLDELAASHARVPVDWDGETVKAAVDLSRMFAVLVKDIDAQRKDEKAPHLNAGRDVDAKYGADLAAAEDLNKILRERVAKWMVAQAQDQIRGPNGATAALIPRRVPVIDWDKLDWETVGKNIEQSIIEKAIIHADKGGEKIEGVTWRNAFGLKVS